LSPEILPVINDWLGKRDGMERIGNEEVDAPSQKLKMF
jgi:hypothetical protein